MVKTEKKTLFSGFTIIVIFIVLIILGVSQVPRLPIHLQPSHQHANIRVTFFWQASPRIIEREVTSLLEGMFNTIQGVGSISSTSSSTGGSVSIELNKNADPDAVRFEVASKIRELYPKLPAQVSYPQVRMTVSGNDYYQTQKDEAKVILVYQLIAPVKASDIADYVKDFIIPGMGRIQGLKRPVLNGYEPMEYVLTYDYDQIQLLGINPQDIRDALQSIIRESIIGNAFELNRSGTAKTKTSIVLRSHLSNREDLMKIPIKKVHGKMVYIGELCEIDYQEVVPNSFYRINGKNTLILTCEAEKGANSLLVADEIEQYIKSKEKVLPLGFEIIKSLDNTERIREEIHKIFYRTLFSVVILLLFVFLISRQWRYLLIILFSLIANLCVAILFYVFFKIEINIYSMAGITVSLGIIIDNTIVMIDHIRFRGNLKVFIAVLAATMTTAGALIVILAFDQKIQNELGDFAAVVIINLLVSLMVALLFVPSLLEYIRIRKNEGKKIRKRRERIIRTSRYYASFIRFGIRYRWLFIVFAILFFGIPVDKLPEEWKGEKWYHEAYNSSIGSDFYKQEVAPVLTKVLGGTLHVFGEKVRPGWYYNYQIRPTLSIRASMLQGATITQMNETIMEMESFLAMQDCIEKFETRITKGSIVTANISISFKKAYEKSYQPYELKSQVINTAQRLGGADWGVYGLDKTSFNNSVGLNNRDQSIVLKGYNLDELYELANGVKDKLRENNRVGESIQISSSSSRSYYSSVYFEYFFKLSKKDLIEQDVLLYDLASPIQNLAQNDLSNQVVFNGKSQAFRLASRQSKEFDIWNFNYQAIPVQDKIIRMDEMGRLEKERLGESIYKKDQQYIINIGYSYVGNFRSAQRFREKIVKGLEASLPLGYSVLNRGYSYQKAKSNSYLIFIIIIVIYFICSVLLESFKQPFAVILMIPLSFIGVFLTFILFELNWDNGGFAAFILLAGLVVNAALYIINDYNMLVKKAPSGKSKLQIYISAYNGKIIPIFLTLISTILGLTPFLTAGKSDMFWFNLASGTMGGLIFSMIAVIFFLPVFLKTKDHRSFEYKPGVIRGTKKIKAIFLFKRNKHSNKDNTLR